MKARILGWMLLMPSLAAASPVLDSHARLLSAFAPGELPDTPGVQAAIEALGTHGDRAEVSLLRSVAEAEGPALRHAALEAIAVIRSRSVEAQREAYAAPSPGTAAPIGAEAQPARTLGPQELACVSYTEEVLGDAPVVEPPPRDGDPAELLLIGRPHRALQAARADPTRQGRLLEAKAREEVGDVQGALRQYADLAGSGDAAAFAALERYGVDAERVLLGLRSTASSARSTRILEVLVAEGNALTVDVLAEQTAADDVVERLTATDALARMLEGSVRLEPLDEATRLEARHALVHATQNGPEPVASLARDALVTEP